MKQKIFVYGTLRKGMYNYDQYLRDEDSFRGCGYIQGSLMTIIRKLYPAFLTEGKNMILGEIHEVSEKTIKSIDAMEGYSGENNSSNEYNKEMCDIYDEEGNVIDNLPVYVYNMNNPMNIIMLGEDIETNDFVQYIQQRKKNKKESIFYFEDDEEE